MVDRSKLPNAFEFVTVAGARAHQLLRGCTPKVETDSTKTARVAQLEVAAGTVSAVEPADPAAEPHSS